MFWRRSISPGDGLGSFLTTVIIVDCRHVWRFYPFNCLQARLSDFFFYRLFKIVDSLHVSRFRPINRVQDGLFFSIMIGRLTSLTVICLPFRSVHSLGDGLRGTAQRCHCTGREGCRIDLRASRGKTQPMGQYRGGLVNGWMHVASDWGFDRCLGVPPGEKNLRPVMTCGLT